jgi:hypothetical protein
MNLELNEVIDPGITDAECVPFRDRLWPALVYGVKANRQRGRPGLCAYADDRYVIACYDPDQAREDGMPEHHLWRAPRKPADFVIVVALCDGAIGRRMIDALGDGEIDQVILDP